MDLYIIGYHFENRTREIPKKTLSPLYLAILSLHHYYNLTFS